MNLQELLGSACEISDELVKEEVAPCFDLDSAGNNCIHRGLFGEALEAKKEDRRMRCNLMDIDGEALCLSCKAYWQCERLIETLRQVIWRMSVRR